MKQLFFSLLLFLALNCFGQSDSIVLERFKSASIIKEFYDTIYKNNGMHSNGKFIQKRFDDKTDVFARVGLWRFYYSYNKIKDSTLYNNSSIPIIQKIFYRKGTLKRVLIADTISHISTLYGFGYYDEYYLKKYRRKGSIKKEGIRNNWAKKIGEWIFYDRKGVIRKRKNYDK